jgi:hypothetical protein
MAKATRKAIAKDTLRELYLKSGNQCAFPGCAKVMINSEGDFVGQICHIEAAEEGGERFNPLMTDDERAAFPNLMLMCYEHHVITNNVEKYTVDVLQKMKAAHEAKFSDIAKTIGDAIEDHAAKVEVKNAATLNKMNELLGWGHSGAELQESLKCIRWATERLQKLPVRTRQLLTVIVARLKRRRLSNDRYEYDYSVLHKEIVEACQETDKEIIEHVTILDNYGLGYGDQDDEYPYTSYIHLRECPDGWFVWGDLKEFSRRSGVPLRALLVELRFDLLD